ncbi:MAG: PilZ domain-containing protein [Gammaproteobacteria bacterium]|nr:PilZ domain-containing protein [Gammaproteobacteria bacterium]
MLDKEPEERRDYFRLNENMLMNYRRVEKVTDPNSSSSDDLSMIKEFSSMTQQFKAALSRINQRLPEVTSCFKLLDSKLNLMAESLYSHQEHAELKRQHVNISGSGMSFMTHEKLDSDEKIEIKMVLSTDLISLSIMAKVVECNAAETNIDDNYQISVKFVEMSEPTQDLIVKHLMQSQSSLLRNDRA